MTRRSSKFTLAVLLLVGCRRDQHSCDSGQLDALAQRLEAAEPSARPDIVAPGLWSACQIPKAAYRGYFDLLEQPDSEPEGLAPIDSEFRRAAMDRACPSAPGILETISKLPPDQRSPTLYDRCQLDRYGVLDRDTFLRSDHGPIPWALHQFMLDNRASETSARVITREMFVAERRAKSPFDVERLPRVEAPLYDLPSAIDYTLTTNELHLFYGQTLEVRDAELLQSRMISQVSKELSVELPLQRTHSDTTRVRVAADERAPISIVGQIFATAAAHEADTLMLAVESGLYEYGSLAILPAEDASGARLRVKIDENGEIELVEPKREVLGPDVSALSTRVAELCPAGPSTHPAVVETGPRVTVGLFVAAATALRSPDCGDEESDRCCFPRIVLDTRPR